MRYIVEADARLLYDDHGQMISPKKWPNPLAFAVRKVTPHSTGRHIVEFHDKRAAADLIAKLEGLYGDAESDENPMDVALSRIPRDEVKNVEKLIAEMKKGA